jgi:hypothetical protein
LLCIITKCNSFSSTVTEAANKPIYPPIPGMKTMPQRPKKRLKTETSAPSNSAKSASYHLRFVPVDSIKHAPSIITSSFDTAHFADKDFSLEFCSRERSLPYFKMIHGRLLLGAIDYNLQHIDIKAVFLLAEATVWMLKNIITKLSSRSNFKHKLMCESAYENYKRSFLTDKSVLNAHEEKQKKISKEDINERFEIDPIVFKAKESEEFQREFDSDDQEMLDEEYTEQKETLKGFSNQMYNPLIVPQKKLPTTLFDLKNLLQVCFIKYKFENSIKSKEFFPF